MPAIDSEWETSADPDKAKLYKLVPRDDEYLIAIDGKYVKVTVTGAVEPHRTPVVVEADAAPFREAATRGGNRA
jgi:hypothetical protein